MFRNYLKSALRNLRKQRLFSLVNVFGMAVGMAGFILLAQTTGVKLNADKFHNNAKRVYGLIQVTPGEEKKEKHSVYVPPPLLSALRNEFPEIENGARVMPGGQRVVSFEDRSFYENGLLFVDPGFLSLFSFPVAAGDPENPLSHPRSVILTKTAASKYFRDDDPIGKILTLDNRVDLTVTGVVGDIPRTSSLRFEFLVPFETARTFGVEMDEWRRDRTAVFVLAGNGFDKTAFEAKLPDFVKRHVPAAADSFRRMYLLSFLDVRLKSGPVESFLPSSEPAIVFVPIILGVLLLLVVSVNFINLSTVRHLHRMKEIGLRKVIGARRSQIILQLLGESILLALIALPLALIFYEVIHPLFTTYMRAAVGGATVSTSRVADSILNYPYLLKYAGLAALLTGVFAGIYPALFLTSFRPVQILSGSARPGRKKRRGSKIMIVVQFTTAVLFIALAGITRAQNARWLQADFGFNRDRVATLVIPSELKPKIKTLQTEIARDPRAQSVTASAGLPLIWTDDRPARASGEDPENAVSLDFYEIDYGFIETLDIQILEGRSFSRDAGDGDAFVLNEAAAAKLGWSDPLGRSLVVGDRSGTVIGVAKNFLFDDLGFQIPPALFALGSDDLSYVLVKYSPLASFPDFRESLSQKWESFAPGLPFECSTLEERFESTFDLLGRMAGFINGLGLIIVFFSGLGLLGLASFTIERRTKEIGIRKILGASLERISWSLGREFFILVAAANVLGLALITIAWRMVMKTGLLFITNVGAWTYIVTIGISLAAACAAVASQTIRAGLANPVESLRIE